MKPVDVCTVFYKPFFSDLRTTEDFVNRCENLAPSDPNHAAKIMMHQTQRLVSISDDFPRIRPQRECLQLLFLIICIETISKIHDGFRGEGKSKKYVKLFFDKFLSQTDKDCLAATFVDNSSMPMTKIGINEVIDLLYGIRCDVVHEGNYWGFSFFDGQTPMVNVDPNVNVYISLNELRDIIIMGCINAINDRIGP
jgi:hypothetical protein